MLGTEVGDELAATCKIASLGKAALVSRLCDGDALSALVDKVWPAIEDAAGGIASTSSELHDKFMLDGSVFTLQLAGLDTFYGGLEGIVGHPNPQVAKGMASDHCEGADASIAFSMPNRKATTTSAIEWRFVASPESGADGNGATFTPYPKPENSREAYGFAHFNRELQSRNDELAQLGIPPVGREEFLGVRLYTGPVSRSYSHQLHDRALTLARARAFACSDVPQVQCGASRAAVFVGEALV